MAKEKDLEWFKFKPAEWLLGRIQKQTYSIKGMLTDACSHYWRSGCTMTSEAMQEAITKKTFEALKKLKFIEIDGDRVSIPFLDEQVEAFKETKLKLSRAGKAGREKQLKVGGGPGVARGWPGHSENHGPGNKEKELEKEEELEKDADSGQARSTNTPPLIEIFFTDLPNSTYFEQACRDLSKPKEQMLALIPKFRQKCRTSYPKGMGDFADHFKNWANKQFETSSGKSYKRDQL